MVALLCMDNPDGKGCHNKLEYGPKDVMYDTITNLYMSRSNQTRPQPISDRNHVLTFGKYKGESIADLLETNPQYLIWLHENSDYFELSSDLFDEVEYAINPNEGYSRSEINRVLESL